MKLLKAPVTYKPGNYGGWKLTVERPAEYSIAVRSYCSGMVKPPARSPTLYDASGTLWMSLMPMESESQYRHNEHAFGDVVVMGAGMGLLPYNLLKNPAVKSVRVVEHDRSVYDHWHTFTGCADWPNIGKLQLSHQDARKYNGACDTLIADIWPDIGADELEADMATFQRNIKFKRMMCWGAELSFISWCLANGINASTVTDTAARRWSEQTGHYVWPDFADEATNAAITSLLPVCIPKQR